MCNSAVHRQFVEPFPFSTFQFLRTCNRLILPTDVRQYYTVAKDSKTFDSNESSKQQQQPLPSHKTIDAPPNPDNAILFPSASTAFPKDIAHSTMPPILACSASPRSPETFDYVPDIVGSTPSHLPSLTYSNLFNRRQRGEKRPIPDEQKDEKYYERRKRNNEAAKKSRDARKLREDRVAFRAAILEHENAILRAQLVALRDEMTTLRQMMAPRATQISLNL